MTDPLLDGLNPEQREAVTLPDQNALVLAGAGSGKTRVLTSRIGWLIREGRATPGSILAVTFTNKASREMLSRIESVLKVNTRGMWVGTFHGLCNRMLRVHAADAGLPSGFQIIDQADQLSVVKRVMKSAGIDKETIEPKIVQHFINQHKEAGERSSDIRSLDARTPNGAVSLELYRLYEKLCMAEGVVDFAELLLRSYELLQRNELIRRHYERKFSHILVDEFQDTNVLQYRWLKTLAGYGIPGMAREPGITNSIFAVGDDDQSIYAFRGANVKNLTDFTRELGVDHVVRLEQNYRSTGHILDAANALIGNNTGRLGKNLWTDSGKGEKLRVMPTGSGEAEAQFVANEIEAEHLRGRKYEDFAILYRSNAQSRALESILMSAGIPYRIYGGHRFFERAHVKDALAYLRLVENPNDNTAFLRAVNTPTRGIGAKTLEGLSAAAETAGVSLMTAAKNSPTKAAAFSDLILNIRDKIADLPLVEAVKVVIESSTLRAAVEAADKKEHTAKAEDLDEIANAAAAFLKNAEIDEKTPALLPVSEDELSPLSAFLALATLEAGDNQSEAGADAVQMMTVHAAKGLEFPVVFITGLEENLFPHASAMRENGDSGLEEERRLMYVAITRAKRRLYLSYAAVRFINGQRQDEMPSSFLDEISQEHLEWLADPQAASRESWASSSGSWGRGGDEPHRGRASYGHWGERRSDSESRGSGDRGTFTGNAYTWSPKGKDASYNGSKDEPLLKKRKAGPDGWQAGQHVKHPKFGKGVIVSVIDSGDMTKLQVAFVGGGVKQLLAKIAKLEKI